MAICGMCGSAVSDDARFCPQCGKPPWGDGVGDIAWNIEVPLLTNPFILGDVGKFLLFLGIATSLIFGSVLGYANGLVGVGQGLLASLAGVLAMALAAVFTLGVVLGNRFVFKFRVHDGGVEMISRSARTRLIHRAALLAGLFTRNVPAMGAGLAGEMNEVIHVGWDEMNGLKPRPDRKVVTVGRRLLPDLHVYCLPENYQRVSEFLGSRMMGGEGS